jgi:uncharacterized protein (TIGR02757 family)
MNPLAERLEALVRATDHTSRMAHDPVRFSHRYAGQTDIEVAALISAALAFGRVTGFGAVLEAVFERADRLGGPASFAALPLHSLTSELGTLQHRWTRGPDIAAFTAAVGAAAAEQPLAELFEVRPDETDVGPALNRAVDTLRAHALRLLSVPEYAGLPRGLKHLLSKPAGGSACKRWCMFLRWMCRTDGVDHGIWPVPPALLVIPLDTHVLRTARFVGLTARTDGSWRTAMDVTVCLRALCPSDPTRYDFALAHLGISGACKGHRHPPVCQGCALDPICTAGPEARP